MSNRSINLNDILYDYLCSHSLREPTVLAELREETSRLAKSRMQIAPEQGQFMALLVKLMNARRGIEVGVFTGYSSLCVAQAFAEDGYLLACDVSSEWTAVARRYWERASVGDKIDLVLAPALETLDSRLAQGEGQSYDFAFIDADKENYDGYYERCLALLRQGGLIILDNMFWDGAVADPDQNAPDTAALKALNKKLHADERIDLSLLPVADGLSLCRKR